MWAHSAFVFEDKNGLLLTLFSGTQSVPQQICHSFLGLEAVKRVLFLENCFVNDFVYEVLHKMFSNCFQFRHTGSEKSAIVYQGKPVPCELSLTETIAIQSSANIQLLSRSDLCYNRFLLKGKRFTSCSYSDGIKRNDSVVMINDGRIGIVLNCCIATSITNELHEFVIMHKAIIFKATYMRDTNVETNIASHIKIVEILNDSIVVNPSSISGKCILLPNLTCMGQIEGLILGSVFHVHSECI